MHCSARQCPPHMYPCNVTGQCIDITKVCNGQQDCTDGTDESSQCGKGKFFYTFIIALDDVSSCKLIRRTISLGFVSISFVRKSTISNVISCTSI